MPKRDDRPVDADVKVPAAVRAAAAAANQLHQETYNPENTPAPNGVNGAGGSNEAEGYETSGADGAEQPQHEHSEEQPQEQAYEQGQEPSPESWEHRYRSLRGRHDSQEQRHLTELRALREHVQNLEGVMASMRQAPVAQPPPELDPRSLTGNRYITPQEEQEYGSEFLGVVGKKAQEIFTPEVAALQQKISQLEGQLGQIGGHVAADARGRMEYYLDSQLPAWREINYNQGFLNWLSLRDVYSGGIRHELLKSAFARNDAPRVLAFFQGFISDEAATAPQNGQPNGGRRPSKIPLEKFAAPGRAQSAGSAPAEKPVISTAQIAQFYADSASGKYRGREEERARLESQIFAAQADGRIVQ